MFRYLALVQMLVYVFEHHYGSIYQQARSLALIAFWPDGLAELLGDRNHLVQGDGDRLGAGNQRRCVHRGVGEHRSGELGDNFRERFHRQRLHGAGVVDDQQRPATLDPMGAQERKVVHEYLKSRFDVETYSEGQEPSRRLVVAPLVD